MMKKKKRCKKMMMAKNKGIRAVNAIMGGPKTKKMGKKAKKLQKALYESEDMY